MAIVAPATPSRLMQGIAYSACVWACLFAALSFYWALGGMVGVDTLSPEIIQLALAHVPWLIALLWITALIKVFSGLVALALVRPWGKRVPRWILLILAWGAGTLLFVHGALFFGVGVLALSGIIRGVGTPLTVLRWYTFLWGPYWLLGGTLFLIAAWGYTARLPRQRLDLVFCAIGIAGALLLLIVSGGTIG